ncbi:hypothetical protein BDW68DRAFT_190040 [Aspergillus falconensis]
MSIVSEAPPVLEWYEDRGPPVRIHFIVMMALPVVAVALRFWSRAVMPSAGLGRRTIGRFWWDDWTALLATIFNIAVCSLAIKMEQIGLGRHAVAVLPANITLFLKLLWALYIIFIIGASVAKASALFFYARVFTQTRSRFRYSLWTLQALNVLWLLGTLFAGIFICSPISKIWDQLVHGYCRSPSEAWLGSGISGVFIDVLILVLPIPTLWGLQMKPFRKFLAVLVIVLGHLVVVVSIGRLASVAGTVQHLAMDPTFNSVAPILWHGSEIPTAVISVSLPSIFLLARRGYAHGVKSIFSTKHMPSSVWVNDSQVERADLRPARSGSSIELPTVRPVYTQNPAKCATTDSGFSESITALPPIPEEPCERQTPSITAEYGSTSTLSTALPQIPEEVHERRTPQLTVDYGSASPDSWARATEARLAELGHV